jgi:hypothetical protein
MWSGLSLLIDPEVNLYWAENPGQKRLTIFVLIEDWAARVQLIQELTSKLHSARSYKPEYDKVMRLRVQTATKTGGPERLPVCGELLICVERSVISHTQVEMLTAEKNRKIPIICSSLNRLPFICPSPFSDALYL